MKNAENSPDRFEEREVINIISKTTNLENYKQNKYPAVVLIADFGKIHLLSLHRKRFVKLCLEEIQINNRKIKILLWALLFFAGQGIQRSLSEADKLFWLVIIALTGFTILHYNKKEKTSLENFYGKKTPVELALIFYRICLKSDIPLLINGNEISIINSNKNI